MPLARRRELLYETPGFVELRLPPRLGPEDSRGARVFRLGRHGRLSLARITPGLLALVALARGSPLGSGLFLVLASLADLLTDSYSSRRGWQRSRSDVEVESLVDFTCFVWAPIALVLRLRPDPTTLAACAVFVLCGLYRLARFNVEGMSGSRYAGLPVTYAGVVVPLLALVDWASPSAGSWLVPVGLLASAAGMASRIPIARLSV